MSRSRVTALAVLSLVVGVPCLGLAPPDRSAPTKPTSLRTTATGAYSVSLSWNPSTDNSGQFSYVVQASNGYTMTVPRTSTSATFATNLFPRNSYTFSVYAVDGAGNRSSNSNSVRATLPADTTTPGVPTVAVTDVGPTHVTLAWAATDNDPYLSYFVFINGQQAGHSTTGGSGTFYPLQPTTMYTVTVQARDHGLNVSTSAPVSFTTEAVDESDATPPSAPQNVQAYAHDGDRELLVTWTHSTDNLDVPEAIRYEVYVNGDLEDVVVGRTSSISYADFGTNEITVFAVDTAGNRSEGTTFFLDI